MLRSCSGPRSLALRRCKHLTAFNLNKLLPSLRSLSNTHNESGEDIESIYDVILPPEPFIFGVSHIEPRTVPSQILRPPYATTEGIRKWNEGGKSDPRFADPYEGDGRIQLGGEDESKLRKAALFARKVCDYAGTLVQPGVTTNAIDAAVHEMIISNGAYPSPLHYAGFPRSCCTSVNNVIVHGIPDDRPLQDGDIINVDITIYLHGFHGDTSRTFLVGNVDEAGCQLAAITDEALTAGINVCGPGKPFRAIGQAIHDLVRSKPFCISPQFTGHGIGRVFHRPPWIIHHLNEEPGQMLPGHCFTIEPNLIEGNDPQGWTFPDGWTVSTENCARSAQAEDMVLITETGAEILTRP